MFIRGRTLPVWQGGLIVLLVFLAYLPALHGGFIWDDDKYVTNNPLLSAPDGLKRIWFSMDSPSQYFPLTYTTFRLEDALWGFNPADYHCFNILLHAVNALLVWDDDKYVTNNPLLSAPDGNGLLVTYLS